MTKLLNRVANPTLAGSMLAGVCTWLAAVEEIESPTVYAPTAVSGALRILSTLRGSARLESDSGNVHITTGSIVLLAPNWAYRRRVNDERWHYHALLLCGSWTERFVHSCHDGSLVLPETVPAWQSWIGEAVDLTLSQRTGWDAGVAARLAQLAEALAAAPAGDIAGRLAQAVAAEPERRWRVEDLAKLCNLGVSGFAHRFRRETGESPARWLLCRRIDSARRLLAVHPPGKVASLLGFTTSFHFSRAFKRISGQTPSSYRQSVAFEGI